jgi:hypothetical protein
MDSVTEENDLKLLKETETKEVELESIRNITTRKMWVQELESLTSLYLEYKQNRVRYGKKESC